MAQNYLHLLGEPQKGFFSIDETFFACQFYGERTLQQVKSVGIWTRLVEKGKCPEEGKIIESYLLGEQARMQFLCFSYSDCYKKFITAYENV